MLTGTEMLFPKELMLGLFAPLVVISGIYSVFFTKIFIFYMMVLSGFIITAFAKLGRLISIGG